MKTYSSKSNCIRAAKSAGLDISKLVFTQSPDGWRWGEIKPVRATRAGGGVEALMSLLQRPDGASVAEIVAATGWLPHTTRARISATVGKKMGLAVTSAKDAERGRVYRVAGRQMSQARAA